MENRKPEWLRVRYNMREVNAVYALTDGLELNTVCRESGCPNIGKCSKCGSATFMILGKNCTRNCRFCDVDCGVPEEPDPDEPRRVADAVKKLGISHAVITSVTRDDLPDGGAAAFAAVIRELRKNTSAAVEVLIPDFKGDREAVDTVMRESPDVLGHNVETVKRLYPAARPQAVYERSLGVLKYVKDRYPSSMVKTAFMVGLGETRDEVSRLMRDVRDAGCDLLTVGQYLAPSEDHIKAAEYVTPEVFADYAAEAERLGFLGAVCDPLARSSYLASELYGSAVKKRNENGDGK